MQRRVVSSWLQQDTAARAPGEPIAWNFTSFSGIKESAPDTNFPGKTPFTPAHLLQWAYVLPPGTAQAADLPGTHRNPQITGIHRSFGTRGHPADRARALRG